MLWRRMWLDGYFVVVFCFSFSVAATAVVVLKMEM